VAKPGWALETVGELLKNYPDGIWLVELAGLSDPELVPQTLIFTLHIQNASGQPLDFRFGRLPKTQTASAGARQLRTSKSKPAPAWSRHCLKYCRTCKILVTKQEILGSPGEVSYSIAPLSFPIRCLFSPLKLPTNPKPSGCSSNAPGMRGLVLL